MPGQPAYVTGAEAISYLVWGEFRNTADIAAAAWKSAEAKLFAAHLCGELALLAQGRRVPNEIVSGGFTIGVDNALIACDQPDAMRDPDRSDWRNIVILRSEVITLAYGRPKQKLRNSRSPYAAKDARLYPRMAQLIQSGEAASSYAAAKAVAHLAEGTELGDHKVRRLQRGFDRTAGK